MTTVKLPDGQGGWIIMNAGPRGEVGPQGMPLWVGETPPDPNDYNAWFDPSTTSMFIHDGTFWVEPVNGVPALSINDLLDVNATSADGHVLGWSSNQVVSLDPSIINPPTNLSDLNDVSGFPASNDQVLTWDTNQWVAKLLSDLGSVQTSDDSVTDFRVMTESEYTALGDKSGVILTTPDP